MAHMPITASTIIDAVFTTDENAMKWTKIEADKTSHVMLKELATAAFS